MRKKPHKKIGEINCVDKILQNETKIDEACSSFGQIQNTFVSIDEKVIKASVFFPRNETVFFLRKKFPLTAGSDPRQICFFWKSKQHALFVFYFFVKTLFSPSLLGSFHKHIYRQYTLFLQILFEIGGA